MNTGFYVSSYEIYYVEIVINNKFHNVARINNDYELAKLLNMKYRDYIKLIKSFGAYKDVYGYSGYNFENFKDAEMFAEYLNDTYIVMLRLIEKI